MGKMNKSVISVLLTLLYPASSYAHGQEVLVTVYGDIFSLVTFSILSFILKNSAKNKIILFLIYLVAFVITFMATSGMPYRDNVVVINTLHWLTPAAIWVITFIFLKRKKLYK